MPLEKRKFNKDDWRSVTFLWGKYTSPFRPSLMEIKKYGNFIDEYGFVNNLLLGATPELRALFSLKKIPVTLVDFSSDMLEHMSRLDNNINKKNEHWLKVNWLDLDKYFKNQKFGLILGDLVLRNLEPGEQRKFLKIISSLLTKRGVFATRIHFINDKLKVRSSSLIIEEILSKKLRSCKEREDLIASRLFDKNTDFKKKKIDKNDFRRDVKNYLNRKNISEKDRKTLNNVLYKWLGQRTWTQRTEKEIEKNSSEFFTIRDKIISSDYVDSEFYPTYVFKNNPISRKSRI